MDQEQQGNVDRRNNQKCQKTSGDCRVEKITRESAEQNLRNLGTILLLLSLLLLLLLLVIIVVVEAAAVIVVE